mgnify:CR=1 FL=1
MGVAPSHCIVRAMIDIVKGFCGIGGNSRSVVDATPCDVKLEADTPAVSAYPVCESMLKTGPYADVLGVTNAGYRRLVSRRVFYPRVVSCEGSSLYTPSVDGWNVVESACLLFFNAVGPITNDTLIEQMEARLVLCACVCIACKNALDHDAFPQLRATQYRHTPLAVVYHTVFERVVPAWNGLEMDALSMQRSIEEAEGHVIKQADNELFRLLNDTPTLRFEADVLDMTADEWWLDGFGRGKSVCLLRNIVSFYVYQTLISADEEVRTIAAMRPTVESTRAFAVIAVESLLCSANARDEPPPVWIPIPLTRLATQTPEGAHLLSIRIVENAMKVRPVVEKDEHIFGHDTMRVVLRALQAKNLR